ncbi:TonB-dependent siderophore receptor [Hyphomicrobium denitrificans 1NES1]|uniref:TonB-dependent siderophore receptor n=1 Tax=Hyphomicrobium denitrificans 1NES1 TaxID=670307 RepID=N0B0J8_9HYPH|nr:TonB-dependent receptor [Hyphomicrobium denitrificans]AGK56959.1 TonB-dependent siderophore receptor [Hyphomicrobium denitrificans 1NES1]
MHHTNSYASLQPATNRVKLPEFTTVDAALYCQINDYVRAQFNVTNLFNENYIVSADSNDNLLPGATRTFLVSLTLSF